MLHALAVVFAIAAVASLLVATAGMITGRPGARMGWLVRVLAVLCFAAAVAFNVAAH
ncbi:MAG TPA: hypothetical protein VG275_14525 [Solirubrobacteraceae bacterium]|nr:hypothetical protein [Solirubrobacteraceae bacterium]